MYVYTCKYISGEEGGGQHDQFHHSLVPRQICYLSMIIQILLIGASMSEFNASELNCGFSYIQL